MSLNLPDQAEAQAEWRKRGFQKTTSKIDRAEDHKAEQAKDKRLLAQWAKAVKARDKWRDRKTGFRVVQTLELVPNRAEAHHVEPRSNYDTRYDVRNGLTLSFETHDKVEHNELKIIGTKFFIVNGKKYIDCTHKVRFVKVNV